MGLGSMASTLHGTQVSRGRFWRLRGARAEEPFGPVWPQLTPPPEPQARLMLEGLLFSGLLLPDEM